MDKIPFTVYDFFAYLSCGAVLVATVDYVWSLGLLSRPDIGAVPALLLLVITYVAGQTVAQFSSLFLEQIVVHRILKRPSSLLMGGKPTLKVFKWLFPNYHRPLAASTQENVRRQAAARDCAAEDEGLFQHAYPLVTADERAQTRLDDFRNQYGFARNMAFAFLAAASAIAIAHWFGNRPVGIRWIALALLFSVTMFYRYLKFFRQFSYELFLRYAALPMPDRGKSKATGA
jgi:hypothetical protein